MIDRQYGEATTLECRSESHEKVDKAKRRREILFIMQDASGNNRIMTAMEVADELLSHGFVNRLDRNNAAPRLTEMCQDGTVDVVGKKKDKWTGKMVTCYQIRSEVNG